MGIGAGLCPLLCLQVGRGPGLVPTQACSGLYLAPDPRVRPKGQDAGWHWEGAERSRWGPSHSGLRLVLEPGGSKGCRHPGQQEHLSGCHDRRQSRRPLAWRGAGSRSRGRSLPPRRVRAGPRGCDVDAGRAPSTLTHEATRGGRGTEAGSQVKGSGRPSVQEAPTPVATQWAAAARVRTEGLSGSPPPSNRKRLFSSAMNRRLVPTRPRNSSAVPMPPPCRASCPVVSRDPNRPQRGVRRAALRASRAKCSWPGVVTVMPLEPWVLCLHFCHNLHLHLGSWGSGCRGRGRVTPLEGGVDCLQAVGDT